MVLSQRSGSRFFRSIPERLRVKTAYCDKTIMPSVMQQTILFKVPGKPSTRPLVILTGPSLETQAQYSTPVSVRLSRALSRAWQWTRCNCAPRRIVRATFSGKVSTVVAVLVVAAMYWHNLSIDNVIEAQRAVGFDCLLGMPWGIVWAVRATRMPMPEEGGAK